ncbi:hypothetical protein D3C81_776550 [compost metagenome]
MAFKGANIGFRCQLQIDRDATFKNEHDPVVGTCGHGSQDPDHVSGGKSTFRIGEQAKFQCVVAEVINQVASRKKFSI